MYFYSHQIHNALGIGAKEGICPVLYFDATGSVVCKPACVKKRIFLYSGVVSFENEIIPCFDFLSSEHSKDFLDIPLKVFRNAVRKILGCGPFFQQSSLIIAWHHCSH